MHHVYDISIINSTYMTSVGHNNNLRINVSVVKRRNKRRECDDVSGRIHILLHTYVLDRSFIVGCNNALWKQIKWINQVTNLEAASFFPVDLQPFMEEIFYFETT